MIKWVPRENADKLNSLLALLSRPSQDLALAPDQAANSVIFMLGKFDLFTYHPRQALLYKLFDVAQSRSAPILVVAVTTKVEVANSPEKRVKTRFGQRNVQFSLPQTLASFTSICQSAYVLPSALLLPRQMSGNYSQHRQNTLKPCSNMTPISKNH